MHSRLLSIGFRCKLTAQTMRLAELAPASGTDGLMVSCAEATLLRRNFGRDILLVVPASGRTARRTMTRNGLPPRPRPLKLAHISIVVGRPILSTRDQRTAAVSILDEVKRNLTSPA